MRGSRKKRGFVVAGVVAALTLGVIGVASTQPPSSSPSASAQAGVRGAPDPHGDGPRDGFGRGGAPDMAEALAELSGEDVDTSMQQRASGQSLARIAKAYGVSTDELLAATVEIEKAELDAAVEAGTLTDARRTQILSGLDARLKEALTETRPSNGCDHGSGRDGDGPRAASPSSSPTASTSALWY